MFISGYANTENVFYCLNIGHLQAVLETGSCAWLCSMGLLWGYYLFSYWLLQGCVGNWDPEHSHSATQHNRNPVSRANSNYIQVAVACRTGVIFSCSLGERRQAKRTRSKRYARRGLRASFARKSRKNDACFEARSKRMKPS